MFYEDISIQYLVGGDVHIAPPSAYPGNSSGKSG
jgi:hypothetical protein